MEMGKIEIRKKSWVKEERSPEQDVAKR